MNINSATLEKALEVLGNLLTDREQYYEVVAIGGGGLLLLGQIERTTKDLDLVALVRLGEFIPADPLPPELLRAAFEVGRALNLTHEWFNTGPASLLDAGLRFGVKDRMQTRQYGGLTVHLAGRFDQICFKLYAAIDQGPHSKHFTDLKHLLPTQDELLAAKKWCITQDVSEAFAAEANRVMECLNENP